MKLSLGICNSPFKLFFNILGMPPTLGKLGNKLEMSQEVQRGTFRVTDEDC
jgi:hypothetical protein